MPEEKEVSAVQKFLGDIGDKGDKNPFEENPEDPFAKQETEAREEVVEKEKPLPFNKDPKIQKYIQKEISKHLEELKGQREEKPVAQETDDYYARLIGNDTPEKVAMIKEAMAREERMLNQAEERAFSRLSAREQEEVRADQEAEEELESAFENIEETFDVDITSNNALAKKTRQEFVSFVEKIAPKDRNGDIVDYPDMVSTWEAYSEMKKSTAIPSRAKELASRGMARSAETATATPSKRVTFNDADEFISSLK